MVWRLTRRRSRIPCGMVSPRGARPARPRRGRRGEPRRARSGYGGACWPFLMLTKKRDGRRGSTQLVHADPWLTLYRVTRQVVGLDWV